MKPSIFTVTLQDQLPAAFSCFGAQSLADLLASAWLTLFVPVQIYDPQRCLTCFGAQVCYFGDLFLYFICNFFMFVAKTGVPQRMNDAIGSLTTGITIKPKVLTSHIRLKKKSVSAQFPSSQNSSLSSLYHFTGQVSPIALPLHSALLASFWYLSYCIKTTCLFILI